MGAALYVMRILITGAGGQLGRALQQELINEELVPLTRGELDITNSAEVRGAIATHRPEAVINAAAFTNVDGAETNENEAYRLNALGARNLALATAEAGIPIAHVSTDYVFDGSSERPYHEFDRPDPRSAYGRSKLAGEQVVATLNPRHFIIRTAWLYHTEGRNFPKTMLELGRRGEVRVVSDQYGSPTYARHLARAIGGLIGTGDYGVRHLAGSGGASWFELTAALFEMAGIESTITPVATADFPRPAKRPRYSVLTSMVEPLILLPHWREGLQEFLNEL